MEHANLHPHVKFQQNRCINGRDIAVFVIQIWLPPPSWISCFYFRYWFFIRKALFQHSLMFRSQFDFHWAGNVPWSIVGVLAGDSLLNNCQFWGHLSPKMVFVANFTPNSVVYLLNPIVWYAICENRTTLKIACFFNFFLNNVPPKFAKFWGLCAPYWNYCKLITARQCFVAHHVI